MAAANSSNNGSNNPRKILIVDDEPDIAAAFEMILQMNGFEVGTYNDPILALSDFKPNSYGLALLDIRMPKMNGFELYKKIKDIDSKMKYVSLQRMNTIVKSSRNHFQNWRKQNTLLENQKQ
jgi:DNA-binding NtrC family response regulator